MYTKNLLGLAFIASAAVAGAQGIVVTVDGHPVSFATQQPISSGGRVLVPLRGVFEEMGATVLWDGANRQVLASKGNTNIRLTIGSTQADVNGSMVSLDSAAEIMNGATLVPLRFLSESLGANVEWQQENRLVAITTNGLPGDASYNNNQGDRAERIRKRERNRNERRADIVAANTVVPLILNNTLSSNGSRKGDRFSARVDVSGGQYYGDIPQGTVFEGVVREARPQRSNEPGVLDLDFTRMRLPNGRSVAFDGSLYSLDSGNVRTNSDGTLIAKNTSKDNRLVYAGYGAGAGLLVGLLGGGKVRIENVLIGGALGALVGQFEKPSRRPSNVTLREGTKIGVRFNESVALIGRNN